MKLWKITQALTKPQDPEWDKLVEGLYSHEIHKNRKQGILLSRQALLDVFQEFGIELGVKDLIFTGYSQITKLPEYTISLSHTNGCGGAIVADKKSFCSVGIDIEPIERIVQDNVYNRISHPDDLKLRPIEIWCLKEAVFKTLMNSRKFDRPLEFSSLKIDHQNWIHSPSGIQGEWELEMIKPFLVARAFLRN